MSKRENENDSSLSSLRRIHQTCEQFEAAWSSRQRPRIEDYLHQSDVTQPSLLLLELLKTELELRSDQSEPISCEEYTARFPAYKQLVEDVFAELFDKRRLDGSSDSDPTRRPLPNRSFAHYELLEEIARGGMGVVYRALDKRLNRTVAVKIVLNGQLASPVEVDRFELEAQALGQLDHPGIVPVYETGQWAGHHYLTMPLVSGQNLAQFLECRAGSVRPQEAVELIRQIAIAIQYAHHAGIIHRDLKPRNILIDSQGRARVTDFGLAKIARETSAQTTDGVAGQHAITVTGQILGTPHYMSPEQAAGNSRAVSVTSDIYSLGVILYELLIGHPPYTGTSLVELLHRIEEGALLPPRQLRREVPMDLDTIVVKCLEKDPARRYVTAQDLIRDLEHFLAGRPIEARPVGRLARTWRWCCRNPLTATWMAMATVSIAAIAIVSTITAFMFRAERNVAITARQESLHQERLRRDELFRSHIAEANAKKWKLGSQSREAGMAPLREALRAVSPRELSLEQQRQWINAAIPFWTFSHLVPRLDVPMNVGQSPDGTNPCDVSPDFKWLAIPHPSRPGTLLRPLEGKPADIALVDEQQPARSNDVLRQFCPTGRWLVEEERSDHHSIFRVWNTLTGQLHWRFQQTVFDAFTFHPNGDQLIVPDQRSLHLYSLPLRQEIQQSDPRFSNVRPAYSHDGQFLSLASSLVPVEVMHADTLKPISTLSIPELCFSTVWHPKLQRIFFGTNDGKIYEWDLDTRASQSPEYLRHDLSLGIDRLIVSPNGRYLAASDFGQQFVLLDVPSNRPITSGQGRVLRFSQESNQLALIQGSKLVIYSLTTVPNFRSLRSDEYFSMDFDMGGLFQPIFESAAFDPTGQTLCVSHALGVKFLDSSSLELQSTLPFDHCGQIAFRPDGRGLTTFGYFSYLQHWPVNDDFKVGPPTPVDARGESKSFQLKPQHSGRHAVWSADGQWLVAADYRESRISIYNSKLELVRDLTGLSSPVYATLSPDAKWIAGVSADGEGMIWDRESGQTSFSARAEGGIAFSPDGQVVAMRDTAGVQIYEMRNWKRLRLIPADKGNFSSNRFPPVFAPRGRFVGVADSLGRVQLFDYRQNTAPLILDSGASELVRWMAVSPLGDKLAVVRYREVECWNLRSLTAELEAVGLSSDLLEPQQYGHPTTSRSPSWSFDSNGSAASFQRQAWRSLARYEAAKGNVSDALRNWDQLLAHLPARKPHERADVLAERARYEWQVGDLQNARLHWEAAKKLNKDQAVARIGLARLALLGPPESQDAFLAQSLLVPVQNATNLPTDVIKQATILHALSRVRRGDDDSPLEAFLSEQFEGGAGGLSPDLRVICGYGLAEILSRRGEKDRLQTIFAETTRLEQELRNTWQVGIRDELTRLRAEVESHRTNHEQAADTK